MIYSVEINDRDNSPIGYISQLNENVFKNGKVFTFKPGVNVIIGKNGCGKTTLLKIMYEAMLCESTMYSSIPKADLGIEYHYKFNEDNSYKGGIDVKSDYICTAYKYSYDVKREDLGRDIFNIASVVGRNAGSTGENILDACAYMFDVAFNRNKQITFPFKELKDLQKTSNDIWTERLGSLIQYYKKNHITPKDSNELEYTFFIDEPDRNLDIENIDQVYSILSFHKEHTQIISVIHNPILIYKLSKLDCVNIIELTPGYLDIIKKTIDDLH